METIIDAKGNFVEPEIVPITDGNYVSVASIGGRWTYGYRIDCAPIKQEVECSVLNEMFESRDNALQAALIQIQHKVMYASSYRQYIAENTPSFEAGNDSINVPTILLAIEDVQRKMVLKVLEDIFP